MLECPIICFMVSCNKGSAELQNQNRDIKTLFKTNLKKCKIPIEQAADRTKWIKTICEVVSLFERAVAERLRRRSSF